MTFMREHLYIYMSVLYRYFDITRTSAQADSELQMSLEERVNHYPFPSCEQPDWSADNESARMMHDAT